MPQGQRAADMLRGAMKTSLALFTFLAACSPTPCPLDHVADAGNMVDMDAPADLASVRDQARPPDLTTLPDLSIPPDLAPRLPRNNMRILRLGDSIVMDLPAQDGGGGYGVELWQRFRADHLWVTFVGTQITGPGVGAGYVITDESVLGSHHNEGHPGFTSAQLLAYVNTYQTFNEYTPDVTPLMIGTNDVIQDVPLTTYAANVQAILDKGLADTTGKSPIFGDGIVILCTLFYQSAVRNPGSDPTIDAFNAWIVSEVARRNSPRVLLLDTHAALSYPSDFIWDGVHPAPSGNIKYGDVLYEALRNL